MNDTLNTLECSHCHGIVDQFGKIYLCRNCRAEGPSVEGLEKEPDHWLLHGLPTVAVEYIEEETP